MKPSPGCSQMLPGLILAKSFVAPRWSEIPGAYSGKIFCCDPLIRDLRGLFRQNLLLRPAAPISPGLILAKSLATPAVPILSGLILAKSLATPHWFESQRVSSAWFCLPYPGPRRPEGIINLVLYPIPLPAKTSGYNQPGFASYTLAREDQRV